MEILIWILGLAPWALFIASRPFPLVPSFLYLAPYCSSMNCKNCGHDGDGKFCVACGQTLQIERVKLHAVLHDVVHNYTHFDKGFTYTLKELAVHPGTMQKKFLAGFRVKNQKPFPMFIATGTISALALYLMYKITPDTSIDEYFFKHYYVLAQALLLPVYASTTWLLFRDSKLYFAEILVLILYMVGFMSLIIIPVNLLHFFVNNMIITLIEIILLAGYNIWTYINFFDNKPSWLIVIKSLVNIIFNFVLFQILSNLMIQWLVKSSLET